MPGLPEHKRVNPFAPPSVTPAKALVAPADGSVLSQYARVRTGLQMIYNSIGVIAGVFAVTLLFVFILSNVRFGPVTLTVLFFVGGLIGLIAVMAIIAGLCMTLFCPRTVEKTLAMITVVCLFLLLGGLIASMAVAWSFSNNLGLILLFGSIVLVAASMICFCLLLQQIGRSISSSRIKRSARSTLLWFAAFFAVCIAVVVVERRSDFYNGLFYIAIAIVALVTLFMYLAMLKAGIDELKPLPSSE